MNKFIRKGWPQKRIAIINALCKCTYLSTNESLRKNLSEGEENSGESGGWQKSPDYHICLLGNLVHSCQRLLASGRRHTLSAASSQKSQNQRPPPPPPQQLLFTPRVLHYLSE